jgi:hypothetical protein
MNMFRLLRCGAMFLDKLWVRIKGELLIMKDDLASSGDLRDKAAILLARLEHALASQEAEQRESPNLEQIRSESEELMKLRQEETERSKNPQSPAPNPRKLG